MKKWISILLVCILTIGALSSCGKLPVFTSMPFNGDISFHAITLTVDEKYIRDSTQSTSDLWFFEHGNYSEYIIISKKAIDSDSTTTLQSYLEYLTDSGIDAEIKTFLDGEAVFSSGTVNDIYCQEVAFVHDGASYAVSLRGGTEDAFNELISTIQKS